MTGCPGGKRLATIGLGLALALGAVALAAPPVQPKAPTIYHPARAFRIPFNIDPADRPRYKLVELWVSSDGGGSWGKGPVDSTTPDRPAFNYRAPSDGEYLFAVRTIDTKNRRFPANDRDVEPNLKVIVDTVLPSISLEGLPRRGSQATVRWEVADEHLKLGSLLIEYQAVGARDWSAVTIRKPARFGMETWDAGTAEPLKVRASVSDRAGNVRTVSLSLPDGSPNAEALSSGDEPDSNVPPARGTYSSATDGDRSAPPPINSGPMPMPPIDSGPSTTSQPNDFNPFPTGGSPANGPPASGPAPEGSSQPILVASPKFALRYEVADAGPKGPAAVEMFVTTDNGRTWYSRGEDSDRNSPFPVDLGGEGTFGLKLVAKSAANQGDQPPNPGEPPRTIVEVDSSGPVVKIDPVVIVGSKATVTWHANDPHPAARSSVLISVRADSPDSRWQPITKAPIDNTGRYSWTLPPNCPARIHVRVDVADALGNRGFTDTTETGAILVDRSQPKGRIIGLEPSSPSARPLRQ